ncbi:uncharacterized protein NEMAJ01_0514 [Nematocida major]|uniref:uncharacterized protein n=1 Tax=Nematocida major TaxID=1912982 RepID=UPI002007EFC3|nr:uncharacterized protein NEMAJ01_0514 [Nematocida major]KAH9385618.1 hypothetical protein NEMAJ01_0514 [Nematocida major]
MQRSELYVQGNEESTDIYTTRVAGMAANPAARATFYRQDTMTANWFNGYMLERFPGKVDKVFTLKNIFVLTCALFCMLFLFFTYSTISLIYYDRTEGLDCEEFMVNNEGLFSKQIDYLRTVLNLPAEPIE